MQMQRMPDAKINFFPVSFIKAYGVHDTLVAVQKLTRLPGDQRSVTKNFESHKIVQGSFSVDFGKISWKTYTVISDR